MYGCLSLKKAEEGRNREKRREAYNAYEELTINRREKGCKRGSKQKEKA